MRETTGRADEARAAASLGTREMALLEHSGQVVLHVDEDGLVTGRLGPPKPILAGDDSQDELARLRNHARPEDMERLRVAMTTAHRMSFGEETVPVRVSLPTAGEICVQAVVTPAGSDSRLGGVVVRLFEAATVREPAHDKELTRHEAVESALPMGVLSGTRDGRLVYCNPAGERLLGRQSLDVLAATLHDLVTPVDQAAVDAAVNQVVERSLESTCTFGVAGLPFERWLQATLAPLRAGIPGAVDAGWGWVAALVDVTESRQEKNVMTHQATHDPLTGLANRTLLLDRLREACREIPARGLPVALIFVDLDGFKAVNDSLGHSAGDEVLIAVAKRMRGCTRDGELVARLGGDEFVVLCETGGELTARSLVNRVEAAVNAPLVLQGRRISVSASVGLALANNAAVDPEQVLRQADRAMYDVKRRRRAEDAQAAGAPV